MNLLWTLISLVRQDINIGTGVLLNFRQDPSNIQNAILYPDRNFPYHVKVFTNSDNEIVILVDPEKSFWQSWCSRHSGAIKDAGITEDDFWKNNLSPIREVVSRLPVDAATRIREILYSAILTFQNASQVEED